MANIDDFKANLIVGAARAKQFRVLFSINSVELRPAKTTPRNYGRPRYLQEKIIDISNIRLNSAISVNKLSLQYQADQSASKAKVFGGYVSLVGTGVSTKAKTDKYKTTGKWTE